MSEMCSTTVTAAIPCIACKECEAVCPMEIGISGTFAAHNYLAESGDIEGAKRMAQELVKDAGLWKASGCICCGNCESVCPQNIKVRDELEKIDL